MIKKFVTIYNHLGPKIYLGTSRRSDGRNNRMREGETGQHYGWGTTDPSKLHEKPESTLNERNLGEKGSNQNLRNNVKGLSLRRFTKRHHN